METTNEIYFYGHKGNFGYMSNFYHTTFAENNVIFTCSEQYLMYHKCMLFDSTNYELLNLILSETSPAQIKKYGRQVKNYNDVAWDLVRYDIMVSGLRLKFNQNESIKFKLIQTSNKNLYEASKTDNIWGVGFGLNNVATTNKNLFGRNLLGKALMQVRHELQHV